LLAEIQVSSCHGTAIKGIVGEKRRRHNLKTSQPNIKTITAQTV